MKTKSKRDSDAYMDGWKTKHDGHDRDPAQNEWWLRGYDDCARGAIDAEAALGPDLLVHGGKRYGDT